MVYPFSEEEYRKVVALLKTYTLYERMILNRIAPTIKLHLIKEHADFRPGKPFTSQLLNIIQHIQDGYKESMIIGTGFVDLSAAKDIVKQRLM